ncbi:MAG: AlpA family phage regulatory protein [Hyphomicrobium sp.]
MTDTLRLLSKKQVRDLCLYSYAHTARLEAQGLFPKRVKLGRHRGSRVGYPEAEITAWLQSRINDRSR